MLAHTPLATMDDAALAAYLSIEFRTYAEPKYIALPEVEHAKEIKKDVTNVFLCDPQNEEKSLKLWFAQIVLYQLAKEEKPSVRRPSSDPAEDRLWDNPIYLEAFRNIRHTTLALKQA